MCVINVDRIKKWIQKQPIVFIFSLALVVISSFVTITEGIFKIKNYYENTIGYKKSMCRKIDLLSVDTQIDYFVNTLGYPIFKNAGKYYSEYIFINKYFYVQAICNTSGKVFMFSVTTRDGKFNPEFKTPFYGANENSMSLILGKTKFAEIHNTPSNVKGEIDVHTHGVYVERYYLGYSGNYQEYIVACTDVGDSGGGSDWLSINEFALTDSGRMTLSHQKFREECVINTYAIISSLHDENIDIDKLPIGPNIYQLRLKKGGN